MPPPLLIAFSHLRWNFVYQRPQHLLSRLAGRWRVLFVEEPVHDEGPPWLEQRVLNDFLTVLIPHTPSPSLGFHDDHLPVLQALLGAHLRTLAGGVDVAWLYTPMALPLVMTVNPACVVYDCMDELTAFRGAPRQLRQRESALMKQASLVLTGGPSLYEARREQHPNVVCLPSAVHAEHFSPDRLHPGDAHAEQAQALQGSLPRPRVGYFGVIDERFDAELIAQVADSHPEWVLVMVGPIVKIDPAALPRRPNLHWLGMQPYAMLPYLLAGWDLCLMPFALNQSTRFISPTKTLEYMAGGKPVVSTPVRDVISMYASAVTVAAPGADFVHACEMVLAESPAARAQRAIEMMSTVFAHSWDSSAHAVHALLAQALAQAEARAQPLTLVDAAAVPQTAVAPRRAAAGGAVA